MPHSGITKFRFPQQNFAQRIKDHGFKHVAIPEYHREYDYNKAPAWS